MSDQLTQAEMDWRERCKAVSLAQGRYFSLLLLSCVFFIALADKVGWSLTGLRTEAISSIGLELHAGTVLASGVLVISLLLHAALGTIPAYWRAHQEAAKSLSLSFDEAFERLEVAPTAIDFVVYATRSRAGHRQNPKLLVYPVALWLVAVETTAFTSIWLSQWESLRATQRVLVAVGAIAFVSAVPRLVSVTKLKIEMAFQRSVQRESAE